MWSSFYFQIFIVSSTLIIELANSIPIKYGMLDIAVLKEKQKDINLAVAEAKSYGTFTIIAVDALVSIRSRQEE